MKSVLILQLEDRRSEPLQTFLRHNKQTCAQHDLRYVFVQKSRFHMPPYWQKIFELDRCMKQYPTLDYFMWLDSDAFLTNADNLQSLLQKHRMHSMIITGDPPPWKGIFNAGAFIVKNNTVGRRIVHAWTTLYNPDHWTYTNSTWKTPTLWAGEAYEQGSFKKHILHHPTYANHIVTLPYHVLNHPTCIHPADTVSVHLAGMTTPSTRVSHCIRTLTRKRSPVR